MSIFVESLPTDGINKAAEGDSLALLADLLSRTDFNDLHGFAICTISDATSVYWTAETQTQLNVRTQELLSGVRQHDPTSTLTEADARDLCRFEPADWSITKTTDGVANLNNLNEAIDQYWNLFDELPDSDEKILEHAPAASRAVLTAIGDGLKAACNQVDWKKIGGRENLAILVWINDPDEPEVVREIACKLNSRELFEKFSALYFSDSPQEE